MSNAITRCPKCHTSFRVTEEILSSAHGSVRCGSCLMIFNAKENLLTDEKSPAQAQESSKTEQDDELIHDDALLDSEDDGDELIGSDSDEEFDENIFVASHASKADINLFERRIKDEDNRELENADHDEAWALSLLEDDDEDEIKPESDEEIEAKPKRKNPFLIIEEDEEPAENYHEFDSSSFESNSYDSNSSVSNSFASNNRELAYEEEEDLGEHYEVAPEYSHSRTDFLEAIEPEPLELSVPYRPPLWEHNGFWFGMSIFAAFALVFQIAYFNFDNFSRNHTLRPYYQSVCGVFSCKLPALADLNKLKVQNMVVMDHPKLSDMLLVDATLINQADFEQAFPTLQLTFTDISNNIVSKMLFDPDAYVGGELSGRKIMPAKHPIHITLELADPGEEALNYQIAVVKP